MLPKYLIELNITESCNFRCTYCFEGDSCLGSKNIVDNIDNIIEKVEALSQCETFKERFDGIIFDFWGGEPTLYPEVIDKVLSRFGSGAGYHLYTNGYTIDGLVSILEPYKEVITIQVSYDGRPINDMRRQLQDGGTTSEKVIENIKLLSDKGFKLSIKSTITPPDFKYIPDAWKDICELNDVVNNISYAPTIDYSNRYDDFSEDLRKSMIEVSKMERDFYGDKGTFLLSWFNSINPKRCTLPSSGMFVDTDGGLYYCHGCVYEDDDALRFGHIDDYDLAEKVISNINIFGIPTEKGPCSSCFATVCMTCNVSKFINSKKDSFYDRWHDYSCDRQLCEYYMTISKVSIALKKII